MSGTYTTPITQANFPDLRILPVAALHPHEENDAQRSAPLLDRLACATHWLNPPIVAPMTDASSYVVLDGANRHYCLSQLDYEHILVQVVSYNSADVILDTWNHAIRALTSAEFLPLVQNIPGIILEETSIEQARADRTTRTNAGYMTLLDKRVFALRKVDPTVSLTTTLRQVVNSYKTQGLLNRVTHDDINELLINYPDAVSIMAFPHFSPTEIIAAAENGDLLPPGITRHIILGRTLRLNYPLHYLQDPNTALPEKNAQLQTWVQQRISAKSVRFYAEPTYLFDE